MTFIWPAMLLSLLALPLCGWLYARQQRGRSERAARLGSLGLLQAGAGGGPGRRRHVPPALFGAGLALMLVGTARPHAVVNLPRVEGTIVLAFDVSGSMAADDLKPTRMEAAKAVARELVQRQPPTVRVGVVAFSEGGLTVQAPTNDKDAILAAIGRITPQRGTSVGQGILAALNLLAANNGELALDPAAPPSLARGEDDAAAPATPGTIVLLSDGENNAPPEPLAAAQAAADRGARIFTVGVGSAQGAALQVEGFTVHTQLDQGALEGIAATTEGAYFGAERPEQLDAIYRGVTPELVVRPEATELTALFAAAGMLLLVAGAACSLVWFGRVP